MTKIVLTLLCLTNMACAQAPLHVANFGGVDAWHDSSAILDTDAQEATNVLTDESDLRTIYGNVLYGVVAASSITFLKEWVNSSNQRVLFIKSGLSLYATDPTSGTITSIATFTGERNLDMVAAFNKAYFVDGTEYPFHSVGITTTAAAPDMEDCNLVEAYQTRLACINTSTESSKVYLSWYNDASSWTVTSSVDSAAIKYFKKDDGEEINCAYTTQDGLFVGKDHSTGMLKGTDNEVFYWYYISDTVGCVDDRTVQLVDGELVWLSKDGFYSYDFSNPPKLISLDIKPYTDKIRASASADAAWTVNTKAGWELGTYAGWDTDILPGSMKSKTYNSGSTATWTAALVQLSTNAGFNDGTIGGWSCFGDCTNFGTDNNTIYVTGSETVYHAGERVGPYWAIISGGTPIFSVFNATDNVLTDGYETNQIKRMNIPSASGQNTNLCEYHTFTSVPTTYAVKLAVKSSTVNSTFTTGGFMSSTGLLSVKGCRAAYGGSLVYFDVYDSSYAYISPWSGPNYLSAPNSFNSGLSAGNTWVKSSSGTQYSIDLEYSANGVDFSSFTVSSITVPNRYARYRVNFSSGLSVSSFTELTLSIFSTGTYKSPVKYLADDVAEWKLLSVSDVEVGVTPVFEIRSATYAFASSAASPAWIAQPKNSNVAASTAAYVQYQISNIPTSTCSVTVNSISLGYTVGSAAPKAASAALSNRYVVSVSSNSSTMNDLTMIWQRNKKWTFTDQTYGALASFNNKIVAGSTTTLSKLWYILDKDAKTFDGNPINASWVSKDFLFGVPNAHKVIDALWIAADNSGASEFTVGWQRNRNGTYISSYTALTDSSFVTRPMAGLFLNTVPLGRQFRFKFSESTLGKYFRLKYYSIYYRINPLIKD